MVKIITREQRTLKKIETPELDKITTTTASNKRRKPQQKQRENNGQTDNNADAANNRVNKANYNEQQQQQQRQRQEDAVTTVHKLRYESVVPDDDDDDDDDDDEGDGDYEEDFEEDDEEVEESETDLLDEDEDDDDDVDEATLIISSDEEEFLETQRISLPDLIAKKLSQTKVETKVTTAQEEVEKCKSPKVKHESVEQQKSLPIPNIQPKIEQNDEVPSSNKRKSPMKCRIEDFPMPMLLPKVEDVSDDVNELPILPQAPAIVATTDTQTTVTTTATNMHAEESESVILGTSKRRRGRPPKSKLTEANVQVDTNNDKPAKRTVNSTTPANDAKNVAILGRISYNATDQTLIYQCTLCSIMFFNELNTYTQHLRTTHQILRYQESPVMVIIPQRKSARATTSPQMSTVSDANGQANNVNLKLEGMEREEQPKDDKENIQTQLNNRHAQYEREPYYVCGLITLYDAGAISFVCKYCNCVQTQEEQFKKHILMEHQALVSPTINANDKSTTVVTAIAASNNDDADANETSIKSKSKQTSIAELNLVAATQAPETPPPEDIDEEKENNDAQQLEAQREDESLPASSVEQHEGMPVENLEAASERTDEVAVTTVATETTQTVAKALQTVEQDQATVPKRKTVRGRRKRSIENNESTTEPVTKRATRRGHSVECKPKSSKRVKQQKSKSKESAALNVVPEETIPQSINAEAIQDQTTAVVAVKTAEIPDTTVEVATEVVETATQAVENPTKTVKKTRKSMKATLNNETATIETPSQRKRRAKQTKTLSPPKEKQEKQSEPTSTLSSLSSSTQVPEKTATNQTQQSKPTPSPMPLPIMELVPLKVTTKPTKQPKRSAAIHARKRFVYEVDELGKVEEAQSVIPNEAIVYTIESVDSNHDEGDNKGNVLDTKAQSPSLKLSKSDLICEICKKSFKKISRLMEHSRLHTGELPFKCDKCDRRFRLKARLNEHKMRHVDERTFKCNICNLGMNTKQDLAQHRRYHTGLRPHACPQCPKAFVRSSDLKIHLRIHTGEKPYVCDICHQTFRANQNLYVHRRKHFGVKNYACDRCPKRFMRKIDLRVHMRTHTGERPFKCEICGRGFSSKFNVRTHIERLHVTNASGSGSVSGNTGQTLKKAGRKKNALRVELERQKELIEELRNQLAQRIKSEDEIRQQQQQQLLTVPALVEAINQVSQPMTNTTTTTTSKSKSIELITPDQPTFEQINQQQQQQQPSIAFANVELPLPMHGMPTAIHMPATTTSFVSNTIGALYNTAAATSTASLSPQLQTQKTLTDITDSVALSSVAPQAHDISILAVFTTQPHSVVHLNNLHADGINAATTPLPLRLQLPAADRTSTNKKERKITSYFNVMGQKS